MQRLNSFKQLVVPDAENSKGALPVVVVSTASNSYPKVMPHEDAASSCTFSRKYHPSFSISFPTILLTV
ncbi:hypothetical protein KIH87_08510 [Paraneptunicella aestuarii]|uniref:hypothetical protein n=1 Tax=Paraneptunicella aestuarii TaxID=2831148 RepID=UPI001E402B6F|nr:hypothetical protein [Paraneptunicella aestuarii]UAA40360.1 hypothetical protein KIH87_08510 [Paraneptunicella aestuarii]